MNEEQSRSAYKRIVDHIADVIRTKYDVDSESYGSEKFYAQEAHGENFRYLVDCFYKDSRILVQVDGLKEENDISEMMEVDIQDPDMDQKILAFIDKAVSSAGPESDIDGIADSIDEML